MARKVVIKDKLPTDVQDSTPIENEFETPNGTQRLGKGLWGIVGNKTRYGTVTQFSGLEYVRYEYRRIPEEFREAAFKSTYLDVIEVKQDLTEVKPVDSEVEKAEGSDQLSVSGDQPSASDDALSKG